MKKINKYLSGILAACMLFTSVPLNAVPFIGDSSTPIVEETSEETDENMPEITTDGLTDTTSESTDSNESTDSESSEAEIVDSETSTESSESSESTDVSEDSEEGPEIITSEETETTTESTEENISENTIENTSENPQSSENEISELEIDKITNNLAVYSDDEEEITDPLYGWEASLLLYDQDEGNGKIGKTEFDWYPEFTVDSNGSNYSNTENKVISMQINYKNTVVPMEYAPDTLLFIVPNLAYYYDKQYGQDTELSATITTGANDGTHSGYEWNFIGYNYDMSGTVKTADSRTPYMVFTNATTIEAGSTFEGSIQIRYAFTSTSDSIELELNECVHTFEKSFNAYMMTKEDFDSIRPGFEFTYNTILYNEIAKLKEEMNYTEKTNELAAAVTDIKNQVKETSDNIKASFDESAYTDFIQSPGYPEKGNQYLYGYSNFNNIKTEGNNVILVFTDDSKMYPTSSYEYIKVRDLNTNEIIDTINYSTLQYQKVYVYENTNNIRLEYWTGSSSSYCYPFKSYVFSSDEEQYINMGKLTTQRIETIKAQTDFENQYDTEYSKITSSDYVIKLTYENYFTTKKDEINMLETNSIKLSYSRTYLHPWKNYPHTLKETANAITSTDNLPENYDDYIWVRYNYDNDTNRYNYTGYPYKYIYYTWPTIYTTFPEGVIVYNAKGEKIEPDLDGELLPPTQLCCLEVGASKGRSF